MEENLCGEINRIYHTSRTFPSGKHVNICCFCAWPTNDLVSMISMILCLAIIAGFRNKPTKLKTMRFGRCACNHWCFENPLECPLNSEVWNSFLILSCLSAFLPVADSHEWEGLRDLQRALQETKAVFESSDAQLYAPNINSITKCTYKFIDCYLLEMNVVLHEENLTEPIERNIMRINKTLEKYRKHKCLELHPCEAHELTNSIEFHKRMTTLLEILTVLCNTKPDESTCD